MNADIWRRAAALAARVDNVRRMIWRSLILIALILSAMAGAKARASDCPGHPNALGTSRVMTIDPREFPRIGLVQYAHSLPLEDKEVVLTFDDGPLPPYTNRVLDVLAEHCVKATYFLVGRMARGYPDLARRIFTDGHTIGTHSENHLLGFDRVPLDTVRGEIEQGIASVGTAVGKGNVAPFFRIPGFLRRQEVETYLQSRHLMTWSADLVADDWKHITAAEVVRRSIARLDEKGKGVVLLHDIQPATALALPELLRQLKAKGYRIVQVVPQSKGETSVPVAARHAPPPAPTPASAPLAAIPLFPARTPNAAAPPVTVIQTVAPRTVTAPAATVVRPEAVPPTAVAVVRSEATPPAAAPRNEPSEPAILTPIPTSAADSLARGEDIPRDPVRPFTSGSKPARNMPTPGKFVTTEPGGWPPVISVPVPSAGGIGVSPIAGNNDRQDGRFQ
jgi:peptidoglycan/xylan/chitin deacetylase (PgdA/CDA1 family)